MVKRYRLGKTCLSGASSTTNPTWTDPGTNLGISSERAATNCLSYGAAKLPFHLVTGINLSCLVRRTSDNTLGLTQVLIVKHKKNTIQLVQMFTEMGVAKTVILQSALSKCRLSKERGLTALTSFCIIPHTTCKNSTYFAASIKPHLVTYKVKQRGTFHCSAAKASKDFSQDRKKVMLLKEAKINTENRCHKKDTILNKRSDIKQKTTFLVHCMWNTQTVTSHANCIPCHCSEPLIQLPYFEK
jgi:hypothetical protein